jgi:hypothetical protein
MRRSMMPNQQPLMEEDEEFLNERVAVTNTKLGILIILTFGLIVAIYAMRYS